jgi:flagellar protein FliL
MAEENTEEIKPPKTEGPKNFLLLGFVLINTVVLGAIGFFQKKLMDKFDQLERIEDVASADKKEGDAGSEAAPTENPTNLDGELFELQPFTANLAEGDGPRRYIRLQVVLKTTKESDKKELEQKMPLMRDQIITLLNTKRPEDLLVAEGKGYLKEEIKSGINAFLTHGMVKDVFYISFQVN